MQSIPEAIWSQLSKQERKDISDGMHLCYAQDPTAVEAFVQMTLLALGFDADGKRAN